MNVRGFLTRWYRWSKRWLILRLIEFGNLTPSMLLFTSIPLRIAQKGGHFILHTRNATIKYRNHGVDGNERILRLIRSNVMTRITDPGTLVGSDSLKILDL